MTPPRLLMPLALRGTTLRNRIVVSPMCQYQAVDGCATDWHLVHLGRFALGGAGLVMTEAAAIEPRGRITHGDLGMWSDEHCTALRRVADFLRANGATPGIQLAHAGRKASMQRPWRGNGPLGAADVALGDTGWAVVAPSALPVAPGWLLPSELSVGEMGKLKDTWVAAARLAVRAGFGVIEIHSAHGYLLHQFLSPLANRRTDAYGGDRDSRMRFPLEVVAAVREAMPPDLPLMVRVSAVDGVEGGWDLGDTIAYAGALRAHGVDVVDCSSGGMLGSATASPVSRRPGYQVAYSSAIKRAVDIKTMAVGLILEAGHAEQVLQDDAADLVAVGREFLVNPNWGLSASTELLGRQGYEQWPENAGWWISRRIIER